MAGDYARALKRRPRCPAEVRSQPPRVTLLGNLVKSCSIMAVNKTATALLE